MTARRCVCQPAPRKHRFSRSKCFLRTGRAADHPLPGVPSLSPRPPAPLSPSRAPFPVVSPPSAQGGVHPRRERSSRPGPERWPCLPSGPAQGVSPGPKPRPPHPCWPRGSWPTCVGGAESRAASAVLPVPTHTPRPPGPCPFSPGPGPTPAPPPPKAAAVPSELLQSSKSSPLTTPYERHRGAPCARHTPGCDKKFAGSDRLFAAAKCTRSSSASPVLSRGSSPRAATPCPSSRAAITAATVTALEPGATALPSRLVARSPAGALGAAQPSSQPSPRPSAGPCAARRELAPPRAPV